MVRLSINSSKRDIFTKNKYEYEATFTNYGYKTKLVYRFREEVVDLRNRNNRARKILWYKPSYNMDQANKIGKLFFRLLKENFPISNRLNKIFKRNSVRVDTAIWMHYMDAN